VKSVVQKEFAPPEPRADFADEPLVIHQHPQKSGGSRHVVIFIHGLGGRRYGKKGTWGNFPSFIFQDFPRLDIGMYAYRTGVSRWKVWRSVPVPKEAEVLAGILETLRKDKKYDWFVLVGHSMGGLLCKGAITVLHRRSDKETLEQISDLVLMATPQLGSLRVLPALDWFSLDARALKAHNEFVKETVECFQEHVHCSLKPPAEDKLHIRTWAVKAVADFWVDQLSAGVGIEAAQSRTVTGTHTEVVKPDDKNSETYSLVRECIRGALTPRMPPFRTETCRAAQLEDLVDVHAFVSGFFDEQITRPQLMEAWWRANSEVFQIIERVTKTSGRKMTEVVGYFCVLPLTDQAADAICSGALTVNNLTSGDLLQTHDVAKTVYIGAIVGIDQPSRGATVHYLQGHLKLLASGEQLRILTRPITTDGMTLVNGHSFRLVRAVEGHAMGQLHENTLTGLGRDLRRKRRRLKLGPQ